jgi:hypothetical protein
VCVREREAEEEEYFVKRERERERERENTSYATTQQLEAKETYYRGKRDLL